MGGTEAVAAEAVEEDEAVKVLAGTTTLRPPKTATGKLRLPKEAMAGSIKKSQELSGASTEGHLCLPPMVPARDSFGS